MPSVLDPSDETAPYKAWEGTTDTRKKDTGAFNLASSSGDYGRFRTVITQPLLCITFIFGMRLASFYQMFLIQFLL